MKHSTITENDVKVLGRVVSITSNNTVASAEQIWDDKFDLENGLTNSADHSNGDGADQYDINRLFAEKLMSIQDPTSQEEPEPVDIDDVVANSNIGTPTAGDILYYDGTSWTLTSLKSLLYWTLDTQNHALVPNTTNTNNYVDVRTSGAIYSGSTTL